MEKLTAEFNYKRYLTMYFYCTVFPLEKTKEGFFKCQLKAKQKEVRKSAEYKSIK